MPKPKRKPRTKADNNAKTRITVELIRNSAKIIRAIVEVIESFHDG